MKILHLRASNFYGGPERQLHMHAVRTAGSDYQIVLGSFAEQGKSPEFLEIAARDSIETFLFNVKNAYDISAIAQIEKYVIANNIELICTHDYRSHILTCWAARRLRKKGLLKWIAFSRGWTNDTLRVRIYTFLEKFLIRFADHVVAVSEAQKRKLERLSIDPRKISVAYNCIDTDKFMNVERINLKEKFRFPNDTIVLVAAGRLSREKGQIYLVQAMAEAIQANPQLRLVLYGDGPDFEKVKKKVVSLNLADQLKCAGFEKNLLGHLKGADILVNPSLSEGLPNIVLEAMALEIPVVATAVGGVPEIINDGIEGLLIPPAESRQMSQAILELAVSPSRRRQLADAALRKVKMQFSFDRQMEALSIVYSKFRKPGKSEKNRTAQ